MGLKEATVMALGLAGCHPELNKEYFEDASAVSSDYCDLVYGEANPDDHNYTENLELTRDDVEPDVWVDDTACGINGQIDYVFFGTLRREDAEPIDRETRDLEIEHNLVFIMSNRADFREGDAGDTWGVNTVNACDNELGGDAICVTADFNEKMVESGAKGQVYIAATLGCQELVRMDGYDSLGVNVREYAEEGEGPDCD